MTLNLLKNRYQILQVLGTGGFGETFLAEDTQMPSSKKCVIKQLIPINHNPQVYQMVQQRFRQEAAILEELGDHPQIPRLYAYFSEDNEFYLVQEYVEGQTLAQKVSQVGVLSETEVKKIVINVLSILEYVHSKGIVHRDIKPDNIILRITDGKPVLIDFGAVKVTMNTVSSGSDSTNKSIAIGTPGFIPIEQTVGRPVYASDLYSLGLTAIYLLTGKVPQDLPNDPTTGNILWRNFVPSLNVEFGDVLDKAIAYYSGDRYPTARDMLTALETSTISSTSPTLIAEQPSFPSSQQETVINFPTPQPDPASQYPVNPTPSLRTWQKVVIIGGAIAGCLGIIGIVFKVFVDNKAKQSLVQSTQPASTDVAPIIDTSLPNPTVLTMDGSTTMVNLIQRLRNAYAQLNPNLPTTYGQPNGYPQGSGKGIAALMNNSILMAGTSRPLKPQEAQGGISVVAIARDAVAVIVGVDNPFQGGLTQDQLRQIYQGKITNWSQVGGSNVPIKVINRAVGSGTRDFFQSAVLLDQPFAPDSPNFFTFPQDETTGIIQMLKTDGISYATVTQTENQTLARIVPIDGISPKDKTTIRDGRYPLSRSLYLAIRQKNSPAIKQFIDLALSPQGQQIAQQSGFIPLK